MVLQCTAATAAPKMPRGLCVSWLPLLSPEIMSMMTHRDNDLEAKNKGRTWVKLNDTRAAVGGSDPTTVGGSDPTKKKWRLTPQLERAD